MQGLDIPILRSELDGAWCNADPWMSGLLEAISLVTPLLEAFFIRTVAECMAACPDPPLRARAAEFLREEAAHSAAHRRLNAMLLSHLGRPPPGVAWLRRLLGQARQRLALPARLRLVEVMEQVSERVSIGYLRHAGGWHIRSEFARRLFEQHAREELGHRRLLADLRPLVGPSPRWRGAWALTLVGIAAVTYLATAVPWILWRKRVPRR